jgi:hypothetical protein
MPLADAFEILGGRLIARGLLGLVGIWRRRRAGDAVRQVEAGAFEGQAVSGNQDGTRAEAGARLPEGSRGFVAPASEL